MHQLRRQADRQIGGQRDPIEVELEAFVPGAANEAP